MTNEEFIESLRHDQKTGNTWCDFHPLMKLLFCMSIGFMTMIVFKWQYGVVAFLLGTVLTATTPYLKTYLKTLGVMFLLGCVFTIVVRIYVHMGDEGAVAFYLFGKAVPVSAVISCLDLVFMIEGFLGIFMAFFLTTPTRNLCYCLEQIGMSATASFMFLSTFACIASVKEKLNAVRESQRARGIETEGNLLVKLKSILPVLFPVIISSMTGIEDKTLAMSARAFGVNKKNTALRTIAPATVAEKIIGFGTLTICIVATVLGKIYL